jgi:ribonuclease J
VIDAMGLPDKNRQGRDLTDIIADTVADLLDGLSKAKRRDPEAVENAVHRAVRAAVNQEWGKKPACHVLVIEA